MTFFLIKLNKCKECERNIAKREFYYSFSVVSIFLQSKEWILLNRFDPHEQDVQIWSKYNKYVHT